VSGSCRADLDCDKTVTVPDFRNRTIPNQAVLGNTLVCLDDLPSPALEKAQPTIQRPSINLYSRMISIPRQTGATCAGYSRRESLEVGGNGRQPGIAVGALGQLN
jgi:hypothetical protein